MITNEQIYSRHYVRNSFLVFVVLWFGFFALIIVEENSPKAISGIELPSTAIASAEAYSGAKTTSQFEAGSTLTQYSLDTYGNTTAVNSAKTLLSSSTKYAAQHMHGFGSAFPLQENTTYDWTQLDRRMNESLSGIDNQVLTACCAPEWMEPAGGGAYSPYLKVKPEFHDQYAEAVKQAVLRYPKITHVQVWNEMKGYFDNSLYGGKGGWDVAEYTTLYNKVYNAVKSVKPNVKVGGPYVVIPTSAKTGRWYNSTELNGPWGWADQRNLDVLKYWFQNKAGGDFISIDAKNHRDGDDVNQGIPELVTSTFKQNNKFGDIQKWIRGLGESYPGSSSLPIWYSEWYSRIDPPQDGPPETQTNQGSVAIRNAQMTDGLIRSIKSGAGPIFIWGPQGVANTPGWMETLGLFTDTRVSGGGQATSFYTSYKALNDHFSKGVELLLELPNTNPDITYIASSSKTLLVNTLNGVASTTIYDSTVSLQPYEVKLINTPQPTTPGGGTDPVEGEEGTEGIDEEGVTPGEEREEPEETKAIPGTMSKEGLDASKKNNLAATRDALFNPDPIEFAGFVLSSKPIVYSYVALLLGSISYVVYCLRHLIHTELILAQRKLIGVFHRFHSA